MSDNYWVPEKSLKFWDTSLRYVDTCFKTHRMPKTPMKLNV